MRLTVTRPRSHYQTGPRELVSLSVCRPCDTAYPHDGIPGLSVPAGCWSTGTPLATALSGCYWGIKTPWDTSLANTYLFLPNLDGTRERHLAKCHQNLSRGGRSRGSAICATFDGKGTLGVTICPLIFNIQFSSPRACISTLGTSGDISSVLASDSTLPCHPTCAHCDCYRRRLTYRIQMSTAVVIDTSLPKSYKSGCRSAQMTQPARCGRCTFTPSPDPCAPCLACTKTDAAAFPY